MIDCDGTIPAVSVIPPKSINNEEIARIVKSIINVQDLKESLSGLQVLRMYLCSHCENEVEPSGTSSYLDQILTAAVSSDHSSCRCIDVIIQYLAYYQNEEVQSDAAWCLTNLSAACVSNEQLALFLPAVPICLQIISYSNNSASQMFKEQCCWTIGNIVSATMEDSQGTPGTPGATTNVRSVVLANGALHVIIEYLYYAMMELKYLLQSNAPKQGTSRSASNSMVGVGRRLQTVLWVLCNLIRTNARDDSALGSAGVVTGEMLVQTVNSFMSSVEVSAAVQQQVAAGDTGAHRFFRGMFELLSLPFDANSAAAAAANENENGNERTRLYNCFFQVVQEVSWVAVYLSTKSAGFVSELALRCGLIKVRSRK